MLQMPIFLNSYGQEPTLSTSQNWDTFTKIVILSYQLDPDRIIESDNASSITDKKLREKIKIKLPNCKNAIFLNIGKSATQALESKF